MSALGLFSLVALYFGCTFPIFEHVFYVNAINRDLRSCLALVIIIKTSQEEVLPLFKFFIFGASRLFWRNTFLVRLLVQVVSL